MTHLRTSLRCSLILCFVMLADAVHAQDYQFEAPTRSVSTEANTVVVDIVLRDVGASPTPILGYGLALTHDPAQLQLLSLGTTLGEPKFEQTMAEVGGWTSSVVYSLNGESIDFSEPLVVLQVTYEIVGDPPLGTVIPLLWATLPFGSNLTENVVVSPTAANVPATLINGSITIGRAFVRGDADNDGGIGLTDVILLQNYLFLGGDPAACAETMDVNADGALNLPDILTLLFYLFSMDHHPLLPFPSVSLLTSRASGAVLTIARRPHSLINQRCVS